MTATVSDIAVRIRQFPKPLFSCAALTATGDTLMVATIAPAALQSSVTVALHDGPVANGRHSGKRFFRAIITSPSHRREHECNHEVCRLLDAAAVVLDVFTTAFSCLHVSTINNIVYGSLLLLPLILRDW
jgi:hypothetical protein